MKVDFDQIKAHCAESHRLTEIVFDNFLMYYTAEHEKFDKRILPRFNKYAHISNAMSQEAFNRFLAQYIALMQFKDGGLIKKYLNHSAVKRLTLEEIEFLKWQSEHPWTMSVAEIVSNVADDFYEMYDVFTGENYLLFSPSIKAMLTESEPKLWLNLVSDNGMCHETFGIVMGFDHFCTDDFFFFASELNVNVDSPEEVVKELNKNPFPFFMLFPFSTAPLPENALNVVRHVSLDDFFYEDWKFDFSRFEKTEIGNGFILKVPNDPSPQEAGIAYFDRNTNSLSRLAISEEAFVTITNELNKAGANYSTVADIVVSQAMHTCVEEILDENIYLCPFDEVLEMAMMMKDLDLDFDDDDNFDLDDDDQDIDSEEQTQEEGDYLDEEDQSDKVLRVIGRMTLLQYQKKAPDFEALAQEYGLKVETVKGLYNAFVKD